MQNAKRLYLGLMTLMMLVGCIRSRQAVVRLFQHLIRVKVKTQRVKTVRLSQV